MSINFPVFSRITAAMLLSLSITSACGLIYKQNIQQGNALEQEDLDELYLGMNKRQVSFVLGSPAIHDPFQQQRWDYVQTFSRRGGKMVQRTVTLRFENDLLVEMIGVDQTKTDAAATSPDNTGTSSKTAASTADPHTTAVEEAKKEVMEPEVKGLGERTAKDRKLEKDMGAMGQSNPGDVTSPDIDG